MPGLIAMMDDEGTVAISYLGTDPPNSKVGAAETKASTLTNLMNNMQS